MNRIKFSLALLGLATVLPLTAGDEGVKFDAGVAMISQLESAKSITNNGTGFSLTGAAYFTTKGGYTVRAGLAVNSLAGSAIQAPGLTHHGVKLNLMGTQVYGDMMIPTPWENVGLVTGLSLQKWSYSGTVPAGAVNHLTGDTSNSGSIRGFKFGARLGLEYKFSDKLVGELLIQQTELGSNHPGDDPVGNISDAPFRANENPGWVQVGIRYRF